MQIEAANITKIKIGQDTEVYLEEHGENRGKIIITSWNGNNYSYFWGSMGGTLRSFIGRINKEYFASTLMGAKNNNVMDVAKTFRAIRRYIPKELGLQWYQHLEFQKHMREVLNDFQKECENNEAFQPDQFFVDRFSRSFIDNLDYYLIKDKWDEKEIRELFKQGFSEPWHLIENSPSPAYTWLEKLHGELVTEIKKLAPLPAAPVEVAA